VALSLLTPEVVHYGEAPSVLAERQRVLATAYAAHPEWFVRGPLTPPALPKEVRINRAQSALVLPGAAH
jgi:putative transposase